MTERTTSMPAALRRRRDYAGPVVFSHGFRPFFLGGAVWAALGVLLWLPQYFGELSLPTAFTPLDWHIHEMLYGYVAAIGGGFDLAQAEAHDVLGHEADCLMAARRAKVMSQVQ